MSKPDINAIEKRTKNNIAVGSVILDRPDIERKQAYGIMHSMTHDIPALLAYIEYMEERAAIILDEGVELCDGEDCD